MWIVFTAPLNSAVPKSPLGHHSPCASGFVHFILWFPLAKKKKSAHCFSLKNKHRFLSLILVINWCKLSWINLEMKIWLLLWGSSIQKEHWSLFLTSLINRLNSELKSQQSSTLARAIHDKTCSYRHKHWLELPQLNVNAYFDFLMLPLNQITFVW